MGRLVIKRQEILFDDRDSEIVLPLTWHLRPWAAKRGRGFYAVSGRNIYMHRLIVRPAHGEEVHHRNNDGLDNRRDNLVICSRSLNMAATVRDAGVSRLRGVHRARDRWRARITVDYKFIDLGTFDDPMDAAKAYDAAARKHFGEFAVLNFGGAP